MRLTRKKSIELCISLWTWLAKTGKEKEDWPEWEKYGHDITNECWFCEYGSQQKGENINISLCDFCPYYKMYGHCYNNELGGKYYYRFWVKARFPRTRKKYAKLFLEQIKTLLRR